MTHPALPNVILGNGNRRFSGVTSTLLQVLPHQVSRTHVFILGAAHMPADAQTVSFFGALKLLRRAAAASHPVVFHARRNIEMVQALLLKSLGAKTLRILFTSTAQRRHSRFTRWLMAQMHCVISTCTAAASYLTVPPYQLIPHGIDTKRFVPRDPGLPPKRHVFAATHQICILGRVRHQKGVDILIEAAIPLLKTQPEWGILVVGEIKKEDAVFVQRLKDELDREGLLGRVKFTGLQPFATLPAYFRHADIVTALSRNEGYGLTVLEAMGSGTAVLASMAGAWPDIVQHEQNGLLVPIDDVEATRTALSALMLDPELRARLAKAARSDVMAKFDVRHEAQTLCALYERIRAL